MHEQPQPTRRTFASNGIELSYLDWGNHHAPPLILLHGNRDHARSWDWAARVLRDDWHVVAVDLRGHGDSGWSPERRYDFAAFIVDLVGLIAHLGVEKVTILAHSMGAHLGLRFAAVYPDLVSRMMLVEPVGAPIEIEAAMNRQTPAERIREWVRETNALASAPARRFATRDEALARMKAGNPALTDEQAHHLTIHALAPSGDGGWRWKYDPVHVRPPFPDIGQADIDALWRAIRCPTRFLYGAESWPSSLPARIASLMPDAERVVLEGAGHWPHHDQFDRFIAEVRAFLNS
ncbi:alpha/beta fold hydrolase [Sphingomonas montanisoli]|nr:alpha/beta hydrolase [Sphingomonas montanisoli]